jgi:hypothetical protein
MENRGLEIGGGEMMDNTKKKKKKNGHSYYRKWITDGILTL